MKDKEFSPMQLKATKLIAWILSLQIAGVVNVVPAVIFLSSVSTISLSFAGEGETVPVVDDKGEVPPAAAYIEKNEGGHVAPVTGGETAPKKKFCREADGKVKRGCVIAGVLLGIGAIIALIALTNKKNKCKKCGYYGGSQPGRPNRPGRPGRPGRPDERPPQVPCCQNPAPAPAPSGGGTTETSEITTGSAPVPGVQPIVVNP